ncbi:MAG: protein phosphatase 2C domain-containing protein [Clostridiales bacterium]|nr:protein phosphatase 2C domain-containing protein [Clostridiales bacterium]
MNQDNFICAGQYMENQGAALKFPITGSISANKMPFFGVFDGMGGEEHGEIAAMIAAEQASEFRFKKNAVKDILEYCKKTNQEICRYALHNDIKSMGTTAAMLAFFRKTIILCNIGDSRVFRLSEEKMEQISYDHVAISAYGSKAPLTQSLGIPSDEMVIEPYVACGQPMNGDIYLICSDGLTDMIRTDEIRNTLVSLPLMQTAEALLKKALANGGRDNITVIVCKIEQKTGWLKQLLKK